MIPWSRWWKSVGLFFVEYLLVFSIFFRDHFFVGPLRFVHRQLGQFRCHSGFSESLFFRLHLRTLLLANLFGFRGIGVDPPDSQIWHFIRVFVHPCPFVFRDRTRYVYFSGVYRGYDYWLVLFV